MTITGYQVQNVLRTYGRQLSRRGTLSGAAGLAPAGGAKHARGQASAEVRRQEVIGRITKQIVARIAQQEHGATPKGRDEEDTALRLLCEEYGRPLRVSLEEGVETFRVADEQGRCLVPVPEAESDRLRQRLYELTRRIVDANMLKA